MESLHTPHLSDDALLHILYEEELLSDTEKAHFEQCAGCQKRFARYARLEKQLHSRLYRRICPTSMQLSLYCIDELPYEERTHIAAHLLDCPLCADEVAMTRQAQANFDPFPEPSISFSASVRRIFATLVPLQPLFVTRNGSQEDASWHHQYKAETLDLSLDVSKGRNGQLRLLGVISSEQGEAEDLFQGDLVTLYKEKAEERGTQVDAYVTQQMPVLTTSVDDMGNFILEPVPAGRYTLRIRLPDREVVIEGLIVDH